MRTSKRSIEVQTPESMIHGRLWMRLTHGVRLKRVRGLGPVPLWGVVSRFGFNASELERARVNYLRGVERQLAEQDKALSPGFANQYVGSFLGDAAVPSVRTIQALAKVKLPAITVDDVNRAARDWTPKKNRVVMVSAAERADVTLPTREQLLAVFDKVKGATLVAFVDSTSDKPLVPALPKAGRVVSSRELPETGITEWTLSNGIRMLLKPTDFRNDEIRFSLARADREAARHSAKPINSMPNSWASPAQAASARSRLPRH